MKLNFEEIIRSLNAKAHSISINQRKLEKTRR